ncbi:MAG: tetratricopeptide repeat protein [Ketobacteraceae bacterium]|nr:tetratricopeptide repeat protein [Ketobacteraceae bacterium]
MMVAPQPAPMESRQATTAVTGVGAVDKLIARGDEQRRQGDYQQAAATLERALRLSPGSGAAYLALARVRLDQAHYREAQQLAEKSLSLSAESRRAQREAWLVIGKARRQLGDIQGAERAEMKAGSI